MLAIAPVQGMCISKPLTVVGGKESAWAPHLAAGGIVTHADGSRVGRVSAAFMCLFVCLSVFVQDISKTDAARITK